jgi:hypothetical protein
MLNHLSRINRGAHPPRRESGAKPNRAAEPGAGAKTRLTRVADAEKMRREVSHFKLSGYSLHLASGYGLNEKNTLIFTCR